MSSPSCGAISAFYIHSTMVKLTPTKMGRAANMKSNGISYRKIAEELKCSHEAVRKRLFAAAERGDLYHRTSPGRPPSPARLHRRIHRHLILHPDLTFWQVGQAIGVGTWLVRKVAQSSFLYRFVSNRKPLLTAKARRTRLKWVSTMRTVDWSSIIFTDECMVRIGDRGRR
jgi:hypothetical protein